jgi:hypothetical protein
MIRRSPLFALLALVVLSWNASAQARSGPRFRAKPPQVPVQEFGSVARTKLLQMGGGRSATPGAMQLGSVQRRVLLTTGNAVRVPAKRNSRR